VSERQSVLIAGGTGFIGSALCQGLLDAGHDVAALTRRARPSEGRLRFITWAPQDVETAAALLAATIGDYSVVINLSGESIFSGRWSDQVKRRIRESRLQATRSLVRAMELGQRKPRLFINASAVGYYGTHVEDAAIAETSPAGKDFLASVCRDWEQEAERAQILGIRVARLRIGVVLGQGGGALAKMLMPFKMGLGGPLGSGRQWMSWIHLDDLIGMILWLTEQPKVSGALNAVAPHPATNREFSKTLAHVLRRPCFIKTPAFVIRLAVGEMSIVLLEGQKVLPQAALNAGFRFRYPDLEPALRQLLAQ